MQPKPRGSLVRGGGHTRSTQSLSEVGAGEGTAGCLFWGHLKIWITHWAGSLAPCVVVPVPLGQRVQLVGEVPAVAME